MNRNLEKIKQSIEMTYHSAIYAYLCLNSEGVYQRHLDRFFELIELDKKEAAAVMNSLLRRWLISYENVDVFEGKSRIWRPMKAKPVSKLKSAKSRDARLSVNR